MGMRMAESALYDLLSWMSPSYPIGAFAHSSGLEWAVEAGHANDRMSAQGWIDAMIVHGANRADATLFVHAHPAAGDGDAAPVAEFAPLPPGTPLSPARRTEATPTGPAFTRIPPAPDAAPARPRTSLHKVDGLTPPGTGS